MGKDKDEILFEIKDNIEIIQHTFVVLFAFIALISMWVFGIGEGLTLRDGHIFNRISGTSIIIISCIYSIYKIVNYDKESHKILFYKNKISKISFTKEKNIFTINEIYKKPIVYDVKNKLIRVGYFRKLSMFLLFPILAFLELGLYLATEFFFKKYKYQYCLILVGINDFEVVCILVEKDKKMDIENYFLNYHNIDIKNLKITWFIPEKNKKG
jgi:hypothetical protein